MEIGERFQAISMFLLEIEAVYWKVCPVHIQLLGFRAKDPSEPKPCLDMKDFASFQLFLCHTLMIPTYSTPLQANQ